MSPTPSELLPQRFSIWTSPTFQFVVLSNTATLFLPFLYLCAVFRDAYNLI